MLKPQSGPKSYFTEFTATKAAFYAIAATYVVTVAMVVLLEPTMSIHCNLSAPDKEYGNPDYTNDPCRRLRFAKLLFLTLEECDFTRRLLMSVLLGGVIGWERRQSDRPAGIRTMSLVSLGSCLFSICSAFAFLSGSMEWDASRVSAAIPSGVGFLGAGLIFKHDDTTNGGEKTHSVHGLTTAASLWLSAAVGIACGGELYFVASYSVGLILMVLRFGPRLTDDSGSVTLDANVWNTDPDLEMQPEMLPLNQSERSVANNNEYGNSSVNSSLRRSSSARLDRKRPQFVS